MRIDKYLADLGAGSRSDLKKEIRKAGVQIEGEMIYDPGYSVPDPKSMTKSETGEPLTVLFRGEEWNYEPTVWYLMNKPAGVLSASEDRHQKTVLDLITERKRTDLFPVGRLDKDTEGLLLITNDGEMAHRLLAPKFHVDKTYLVRTAGTPFTEADAVKFAAGIQYDESLTALPAGMKIAPWGDAMEALVTIREGKFHQIKKMVAALGGGKEVTALKRVSFGPLELDESLEAGEYRRLSEEEVQQLEQCCESAR